MIRKCQLCDKEYKGFIRQKYCSGDCMVRQQELMIKQRRAELKSIKGELEIGYIDFMD